MVARFDGWKRRSLQQKPHLLFLANHYRGPGRSGGARTWHQVRELVKSFRVTLVIPSIDPLTQEDISSEKLPEFEGMKLKIAHCWTGSRKSLWGRLVYQLSSAIGTLKQALLTRKPDVVLAMGAPPGSALAGLLTAKAKRVPILLDVRDIPLETAEELGLVKQTWVLRIARLAEGIIFRRADMIICVSDEMAEFVIARGTSPERVTTNYIGYDNFDNTSETNDESRMNLLKGLNKETCFIVFYAGTLATLVDISTVLRAAENVKNNKKIGFVIVGDGERRKWYEDWVASEDLNVHFTGRVPKQQVHTLCTLSNVCVYPLLGGPATGAMLGNKVFDYLGAGKPIIYTGPDGAVARLIQRVGAGYVLAEKDFEGLSRIILELSQNPEMSLTMGEKGKRAVLENMTAAHSARVLSDMLIQLLER